MNCIIFGGSGFLGSHVADELTSRGHIVSVFDKVKSPYIQTNQKMIIGDILDEIQIELMKGIKRVFDPNNILNPGKIFSLN